MTGIMIAIVGCSSAPILDTQTVTRGQGSVGADPATSSSGFRTSPAALGSISDGTSNVYSGAPITELYYTQTEYFDPVPAVEDIKVVWRVGSAVANSGWSRMLIGTTVFNRADATFTTGAGYSQWEWPFSYPGPSGIFTPTFIAKWY